LNIVPAASPLVWHQNRCWSATEYMSQELAKCSQNEACPPVDLINLENEKTKLAFLPIEETQSHENGMWFPVASAFLNTISSNHQLLMSLH